MKMAVYSGIGAIGIREQDLPDPEPGWVRVAISSAGICGTDLHIYHAALGDPAGMQPGHEIAGWILAAGDGTHMETGTHVAVEPLLGCGGCHPCRVGKANLCSDVRLFGIALPGGLAEYICVPESLVHPLPADLGPAAAGLTEPMAVCVRGARIGRISMGDRVAIIGAGSIGLLSTSPRGTPARRRCSSSPATRTSRNWPGLWVRIMSSRARKRCSGKWATSMPMWWWKPWAGAPIR